MTPRKRRVLAVGLAMFFGWLGLATWITVAGQTTDLRKVDCILVPGAKAEADGTPGVSLTGRVNRAVELWKEGWAPAILFTGGRGETGTVEGEVAQRYAVSQGVPLEATDLEGSSHNTRQNFEYAREVMQKHGWKSCLVVTDPFHEPRCMLLAHDTGVEAYPAPTFSGPAWKKWGTLAFYTCRETVSMAKYTCERIGL